MTSACIFKHILRNRTQIFLEFKNSILRFVYISFNFNCTLDFLPSIHAEQRRGNIKGNTASAKWTILISDTDHSTNLHLLESAASIITIQFYSSSFDMSSNISLDFTDSDVFYVEQISNEPSPRRNNSPDILNSTETSQHHAVRMPSISTIASPQPYIFTINDDSNEPTLPYGFGRQLPIVPPSLNDLNLPPNPFNIVATMAIASNTGDANNDDYSPQSPEPSLPSPISTPPMNVSAYNSWETSYTTTDDDTFLSSDEPRRIYFLPPSPSPPPSPPRRQKRMLSLGMSFPKEGGVSQHIRRSPQQRTPQVHLAEVRDSDDTSNLYANS